MPLVRPTALVALAWLGACAGRVAADGTDAAPRDAAPSDAASPTTCTWPTSFDKQDAEPMRDSCRAARMLLRCQGSDGSNVLCIADKAQCDLPPKSGVTYSCTSACKTGEFGVLCGNATGSSVQPPADCRSFPMAGGVSYCCTCNP